MEMDWNADDQCLLVEGMMSFGVEQTALDLLASKGNITRLSDLSQTAVPPGCSFCYAIGPKAIQAETSDMPYKGCGNLVNDHSART